MKLALGRAIGLVLFMKIDYHSIKKKEIKFEDILIVCRYLGYSWHIMDHRVASGILWSSTVTLWCSDGVDTHCFLLCCVSFSWQYILMFACARKCSKVLPTDTVGGAHFFIMHENKIHIG